MLPVNSEITAIQQSVEILRRVAKPRGAFRHWAGFYQTYAGERLINGKTNFQTINATVMAITTLAIISSG